MQNMGRIEWTIKYINPEAWFWKAIWDDGIEYTIHISFFEGEEKDFKKLVVWSKVSFLNEHLFTAKDIKIL